MAADVRAGYGEWRVSHALDIPPPGMQYYPVMATQKPSQQAATAPAPSGCGGLTASGPGAPEPTSPTSPTVETAACPRPLGSVRMVPLADLRPWEQNYRHHPAEQRARITESIRRNGQRKAIVVQASWKEHARELSVMKDMVPEFGDTLALPTTVLTVGILIPGGSEDTTHAAAPTPEPLRPVMYTWDTPGSWDFEPAGRTPAIACQWRLTFVNTL